MSHIIVIPGEPCGKQRPRVVRNNGVSRTYTPVKTANYESLVKLAYRQARGPYIPDKPVELYITACHSVPRSVSKRKAQAMLGGAIRPTKKPDCDNIAKIICDALNGVAYHDDAQIVRLTVAKRYSETPQVTIEIREVNP